MEVECGDIVEILWPRKGCGYHLVLGHTGNDSIILSITNDQEFRNAVVTVSQIERIVEKAADQRG